MTRVALYARYSSDNQRDASIEDQLRQSRDYAERQGWTVAESYVDRAISGASLIRPGIQKLMVDVQMRQFDIVLSEALDRISRDQEDVAAVFKRMRFAGVRLVTLSEGEISELHVGLKGTMNALFLKDLALKTHRGIRGRVEAGELMGRANWLRGRLFAKDATTATFRSAHGWEMPVPAVPQLPEGEIDLCVRPETLDVSPVSDEQAPAGLVGRVEDVVPLGAVLQMEIVLGGDVRILATQSNRPDRPYRAGQQVQLSAQGHETLFYPASTGT